MVFKQYKLLLLVAGVLLQQGVQAEVFKCKDAEGNISYGETPCKGKTRLPYEAGRVTTIEAIPVRDAVPDNAPDVETPSRKPASAAQVKPTPDPDLPAGVNCNLDNPDYDPNFCKPGNLRSLYGKQPAKAAPTAKH